MEKKNHQEQNEKKCHQKLDYGGVCVFSQLGSVFSDIEVFYSCRKAI